MKYYLAVKVSTSSTVRVYFPLLMSQGEGEVTDYDAAMARTGLAQVLGIADWLIDVVREPQD